MPTHVVLSCTSRKRVSASSDLTLRNIHKRDVTERACEWIERAKDAPAIASIADLYAGEYWHEGLGLVQDVAAGGAADLWAVSAGLGLVNGCDRVPAYAATFNRSHLDSVVTSDADASTQRQLWWHTVAKWSGCPTKRNQARTIESLARDRNAHLLICVGPDYLDAITDDLRRAQELAGSRMVVISSGQPMPGFEDVWVQYAGKLRLRFGGSLSSTGIRLARALVEKSNGRPLDAADARDRVRTFERSTAALPRFDGSRLSDADVVKWIRADARANPGTSKTAALRRLRDAGHACEQHRFGELHASATAVGRRRR